MSAGKPLLVQLADPIFKTAALRLVHSETCYQEMKAGSTGTWLRDELIKSAIWRAARYGDSDRLIDPKQQGLVPAYELVSSMLQVLRPVLEDRGDWNEVQGLVTRVRSRGTGASRQLAQFEKTGRMQDVVDLILNETVAGLARLKVPKVMCLSQVFHATSLASLT